MAIIAFLGKGGSGKSTLATALTKYLHADGNTVLAIDADHNMDLTWNLIQSDTLPYLGESIGDLNEYVGIDRTDSYKDIFYRNLIPKFSLTPQDSFTKKYSKEIKPKLHIMAAGPHTDTVLHGNKCSHSLATSLKVYLPFLKLQNTDFVVIDEKASSDAAGTGVPTGFTVSYIVVEPTLHSIKAAHQIAKTLEFYNAPYAFVLNKINTLESQSFALEQLRKSPIAQFSFGIDTDTVALKKLLDHAQTIERETPLARQERSIDKFKNGKKYAEEHNLS